jgi:DNA polymerase III subunit epsilon
VKSSLERLSVVKLNEVRALFLDIQTTGANPTSGRPLEIAWTVDTFGELADIDQNVQSHLLEQPEGTLPKRISVITGIKESDLCGARGISEVSLQLQQSLAAVHGASLESNPVPCIIHFARFEQPFIDHFFPDVAASISVFCTHQIAARLFPNLPSRGLRGLSGFFGMSLGDCKRAQSHVQATYFIWRHLREILVAQGITTVKELGEWLRDSRPAKRTKYEYPLAPETRLSLPDKPGVYKMIAANGDILYVGKATSLKQRVNSYFRGRKGKDSFKLEMLTRVKDIQVTPCATVLEACLLEVEEIKRLNPPYNICLKQSDRPLVFYAADFSAASDRMTSQTPIGPFRSELVMDSFIRLLHSLAENKFDSGIFFDELPEELLSQGFEEFVRRHGTKAERLLQGRSLMALALKLFKVYRQRADQDAEQDPEEATVDALLPEDTAKIEKAAKTEVEQLTPEEVADKYERMLVRSARGYLQSKRMSKLLHSSIQFEEASGRRGRLRIVKGEVCSDEKSLSACSANTTEFPWSELTLNTFDRMRVLDTELLRLRLDGRKVEIKAEAWQCRHDNALAAHSKGVIDFLELPSYLPYVQAT